jgi:hypothetical protein
MPELPGHPVLKTGFPACTNVMLKPIFYDELCHLEHHQIKGEKS